MSAFKVTPRAQKSLEEIGRYTLKKWGREQRNKYLHEIDNRFEWLAQHPYAGRTRYDIGEKAIVATDKVNTSYFT